MFILILANLQSFSQEHVSVTIYQDLKLATVGDGYYDAFTIDVIARLKMQGNQQKWGYLVVFPEFEYAEIDGIYKRWSANVGYTFNQLILKNFEANISGGFGWIDRYSASTFSFSASGELAYKLSNRFKVIALGQFTQRKDLELMYNDKVIRFSGFVGVEIKI